MKYIKHLFLLVVLFVANSIAATLNIGPVQYTLQLDVGGHRAVWRSLAGGVVLTKQALQTHLDSPAIKPHCLKEIIRLIMAQQYANTHIANMVGGSNVVGNNGFAYITPARVANIPRALAQLKNHLLEQGHLGFYPMVTGAVPGQKINKDRNRSIFNISRTSASAVTNYFYGAAVGTPGPPLAPGAANPIVPENADKLHLYPIIHGKDMARFFLGGHTFAQARLTVPTPAPAPPAVPGAGRVARRNTGNWYAAFDAIVGAAGPTFTQIADGILRSTFSQGGLHEVTISDSVDRAHPELKFEIDCVLNPDLFANGILNDLDFIGREMNGGYTNALKVPVKVDDGTIRVPTVFPVAAPAPAPAGILHRVWNVIPTPVKYLGAMALGAIGWPLVSRLKWF